MDQTQTETLNLSLPLLAKARKAQKTAREAGSKPPHVVRTPLYSMLSIPVGGVLEGGGKCRNVCTNAKPRVAKATRDKTMESFVSIET